MTKITTHVLDISLGKPAANIQIMLESFAHHEARKIVAEGVTNKDGRVSPALYDGANLEFGLYCISFSLTRYFADSKRSSLYPLVTVHFVIDSPGEHFHLPLLVSPHGYSTYRGS